MSQAVGAGKLVIILGAGDDIGVGELRGGKAGGDASEGSAGGESAVQVVGDGHGTGPIDAHGVPARSDERSNDNGEETGKRDAVARLADQEAALTVGDEQAGAEGDVGEDAGKGSGGTDNSEDGVVGRGVAVDEGDGEIAAEGGGARDGEVVELAGGALETGGGAGAAEVEGEGGVCAEGVVAGDGGAAGDADVARGEDAGGLGQ